MLRLIGWLSWKAADFTAWILDQVPDREPWFWLQGQAYGLYNVTARFAFWFDERFNLGQTEKVV